MANRSLKIQIGVIESIVVQVREVIMSTDFVVLDMENIGDVLLILERLFLATTQVNINVANATMTLIVDGKKIRVQPRWGNNHINGNR